MSPSWVAIIRSFGLAASCGLSLLAFACTCEGGDELPEAGPAKRAESARGRVLADAPLPIEKLLGSTPEVVESHLGAPLGKGGTRDICVRFVPERTWFRCTHAWQRYAAEHPPFSAIGVEYEDGRASALSWQGLAGSGPFDPAAALRQVGLELPGAPLIERPRQDVTVWSYPNARSGLVIHGREYRVRVSTIGDDWSRGKVELVLNDPLNPDEERRRLNPGESSRD